MVAPTLEANSTPSGERELVAAIAIAAATRAPLGHVAGQHEQVAWERLQRATGELVRMALQGAKS